MHRHRVRVLRGESIGAAVVVVDIADETVAEVRMHTALDPDGFAEVLRAWVTARVGAYRQAVAPPAAHLSMTRPSPVPPVEPTSCPALELVKIS